VDDDGAFQAAAERDVDRLADADLACRLHAVAVHVHASARDRFGREAPRLVETGGPEPPVDAHAFHHSSGAASAGVRTRCAQTTQRITATAVSTVTGVTRSSRRSADQMSVSSACSCCTWPPRAIPASARPRYHAKKPRYMEETPSRTSDVH